MSTEISPPTRRAQPLLGWDAVAAECGRRTEAAVSGWSHGGSRGMSKWAWDETRVMMGVNAPTQVWKSGGGKLETRRTCFRSLSERWDISSAANGRLTQAWLRQQDFSHYVILTSLNTGKFILPLLTSPGFVSVPCGYVHKYSSGMGSRQTLAGFLEHHISSNFSKSRWKLLVARNFRNFRKNSTSNANTRMSLKNGKEWFTPTRIAWLRSSTAFPFQRFLFSLPSLRAGANVTNNSENNRSWRKLAASAAKGQSHRDQEGETAAERCTVCLCLPCPCDCASVRLGRCGFASVGETLWFHWRYWTSTNGACVLCLVGGTAVCREHSAETDTWPPGKHRAPAMKTTSASKLVFCQ